MADNTIKPLTAQVELTQSDLRLLQNALNEVLNGLDLTEFETRMGGSRYEVLELVSHLNQVAKHTLLSDATRNLH